MKKTIALSLTLFMILALGIAPAAMAVSGDMSYSFVLSASKTSAKVGDEITVTLTLTRTDANADYPLYSMQDEISYDTRYFELVGSVSLTDPAFNTTTRSMSDGIHNKLVVSFIDFSGSGATKAASFTICTFTLRALASGTSTIANTDYKVNLPSGLDVYASTSNSLSITVTGSTSGGSTDNGDNDDDESGNADVVFSDVSRGAWYYDAVQFVVAQGLFEGTGGSKFSPDRSMTRAMLVTVLYRLEGKPAVSGTNGFTDVKSGEWYTSAVTWASRNGIVEGYGNGLFGTGDNITREQMAAILYRYAVYKGYNVSAASDLAGYTDAGSISPWALGAMKWANAEGFVNGRTVTTLVPAGTATRAEVAMIFMRFADRYVSQRRGSGICKSDACRKVPPFCAARLATGGRALQESVPRPIMLRAS